MTLDMQSHAVSLDYRSEPELRRRSAFGRFYATQASKLDHKPGDIVMCHTSYTSFCVVTDQSVKTADGDEWYLKPVTVEQALEGRANQEKMTSDTIASLKQIAADSFNEGCGGSLGIGIVCKLSMGFGATNPITETKATTGERIGWFAQALLNIVGLKAAVGSVAGENVIKDGAGGSLKPSISYDPPGSVVLQGDAPVCGSACAAMTITGNTGRSLSLVDAIGGFANGIRSSGVNTLELSEVYQMQVYITP